MPDSFTHLHVHTEFSMLDGASRVADVVAAAAADGQPALGITDHGNMYGVLPFYAECRKQGVTPVIGFEAYMAHDRRDEKLAVRGNVDDTGGEGEGGKKAYYHLTLLAESNTGYKNLIQLASRAFLEGYYRKPKVDWEILAEHSEGVIATTGCLGGHVLQSLLHGDVEGAAAKAGRLQDIFGRDNLFVELQDHGIPEQHKTNPQLIEIARRINAPLLATNDSHYTPARGRGVPRRTAVRADREAHLDERGRALQVQGRGPLPEERAGDALPVPRGRSRLRQLAVDRGAGERRDRVREGAAARLPAAPRLRRRHRLLAPPHVGGRDGSAGATPCPSRSSTGSTTS